MLFPFVVLCLPLFTVSAFCWAEGELSYTYGIFRHAVIEPGISKCMFFFSRHPDLLDSICICAFSLLFDCWWLKCCSFPENGINTLTYLLFSKQASPIIMKTIKTIGDCPLGENRRIETRIKNNIVLVRKQLIKPGGALYSF